MLDLEQRPLKRVAPTKHWRNWYQVHRKMAVSPRVGVWYPGLTRGPDLFPSKEIAEQYALDFIASVRPESRSWFDHLGARPDGVRPD